MSQNRRSPAPASCQSLPLEELVPYIDWSPFFHTWELRGRYPAILDDPKAKELFDDAQKLLQRIVSETLHGPQRAVHEVSRPNSYVGDDIELYTDESRTGVLTTFHTLRQQMDKPQGQFNHALADFIAPKSTGLADWARLRSAPAMAWTGLARPFRKETLTITIPIMAQGSGRSVG